MDVEHAERLEQLKSELVEALCRWANKTWEQIVPLWAKSSKRGVLKWFAREVLS